MARLQFTVGFRGQVQDAAGLRTAAWRSLGAVPGPVQGRRAAQPRPHSQQAPAARCVPACAHAQASAAPAWPSTRAAGRTARITAPRATRPAAQPAPGSRVAAAGRQLFDEQRRAVRRWVGLRCGVASQQGRKGDAVAVLRIRVGHARQVDPGGHLQGRAGRGRAGQGEASGQGGAKRMGCRRGCAGERAVLGMKPGQQRSLATSVPHPAAPAKLTKSMLETRWGSWMPCVAPGSRTCSGTRESSS